MSTLLAMGITIREQSNPQSDLNPDSPYRSFYAAVMQRAVTDLISFKTLVLTYEIGKWAHSAHHWFLSDPSNEAVTFKDCCSVLDLNAEEIISEIKKQGHFLTETELESC